MKSIKNIIREELEKIFNDLHKVSSNKLKKDILYLDKFDFLGSIKKDETTIWAFETKKDKAKFNAIIKNRGNDWFLNLEMEGVIFQKGETTFKTSNGYDDFVKTVNKRLKNDLLWNFKNFSEDKERTIDNEIKELIKVAYKNEKQIFNCNHHEFDDLKQLICICKEYDNTNTKKLIKKLLDVFNKKEKILKTLQKVYKLDFYNSMM